VVPFEHSSGTSIKGRHRLSYFADKELKKLLHLSAMSVIRLDGELKEYYQRKVAEGKNKMSVLNAVRNKLVHRICAVVNQKRNYKPVLDMS
jgi:transposase